MDTHVRGDHTQARLQNFAKNALRAENWRFFGLKGPPVCEALATRQHRVGVGKLSPLTSRDFKKRSLVRTTFDTLNGQ